MNDPLTTLCAALAFHAGVGTVYLAAAMWQMRGELLSLPQRYQDDHPFDPPLGHAAQALCLCFVSLVLFLLALPAAALAWPWLISEDEGGRP